MSIAAATDPGGPITAGTVAEIIARASGPDYDSWWAKVTASGYCAAPVHLHTHDGPGGSRSLLARCKNRRASVCPSCSDLYAGDTWHLVHAGIGGGHSIPDTVAAHPAVFATLTAPGFGAVHAARKDGAIGRTSRCHSTAGGARHCQHGRRVSCARVHDDAEEMVGQPLCQDCYDYPSQVLFAWHAPQLWARFTLTLRRLLRHHLTTLGEAPASVRVSFVKIVELQRRAVPHFHTVIRLDTADNPPGAAPQQPDTRVSADTLAVLVQQAVAATHLDVPGVAAEVVRLRFGAQTDTQALTRATDTDTGGEGGSRVGRRVAGYLAKYVTKSLSDFGITARRLSPQAIDRLDVTEHIRVLLHTITELASEPGRETMTRWLHTLGYRGHITTKSRRYSTTMGALRTARAAWHRHQLTAAGDPSASAPPDPDADTSADSVEWTFNGSGHATAGERLLAVTAAISASEARWTAREATDPATDPPWAGAP